MEGKDSRSQSHASTSHTGSTIEGGGSKKMEGTASSRTIVQSEFTPYTAADTQVTTVTMIIHDFWKHLKAHYKPLIAPRDYRKVLVRTEKTLRLEPPPDAWARKRHRIHTQAESSGMLSYPWLPYSSMGDVELDTIELIQNNLVSTFSAPPFKDKREEINTPPRSVQTSVRQSASTLQSKHEFEVSEISGLKKVHEAVQLMENLRKALRGKQKFQQTLERLKEEVEIRRRGRDPRFDMEAMPLEDDNPLKRDWDHKQRMRKTIDFTLKLEALAEILKMLVNIKDRDVRQEKPLSQRLLRWYRTGQKITGEPQIPRANPSYKIYDPLKCLPHGGTLDQIERSYQQKKFTDPDLLDLINTLKASAAQWNDLLGEKQENNDLSKEPGTVQTPEEKFESLRASFERVLKKTGYKYDHQIEKKERETIHKYKYIFWVLGVLPLRRITQVSDIANMANFFEKYDLIKQVERSAKCSIAEEESKDDSTEDTLSVKSADRKPKDKTRVGENVALWYELLLDETRNLKAEHNKKVTKLLDQIFYFQIKDLGNMPYVQEKLCLLVMSLPIPDLCNTYWQQALKYIAEEIIDGPVGAVETWLEQRSIPLMLKKRQKRKG